MEGQLARQGFHSPSHLTAAFIAIMLAFASIGTAVASRMSDFVHNTLQWTGAERPSLAISRGLVLAWLPDPATFLPSNPGDYYWRTNERRLVVAPGVPLMLFPPRLDRTRAGGDRGRLSDPQYQLAVTQDGFWGVLDTSQSKSILIESDLRKIVDQESSRGPESQFGILVQTSYQIPGPLPVTLSRGEVFRITSDSSSTPMTIAFDSEIANMKSKLDDIAVLTKKNSMDIPSVFPIDENTMKYVDIRISGALVTTGLLKDWRAAAGHYEEIFSGSFSSLRVPDLAVVSRDCDSKTTIKSASDKEVALTGSAGVSISAKIFSYFETKADLSASGKDALKKTIDVETTVQPTVKEHRWLIEYQDRGQPATTYWVGTAQTCASPSWSTLITKVGDDERFLHSSFYSLVRDKAPALADDDVQKKLGLLKPGGNPWSASDATFKIGCFAQALSLEDLSLAVMGDSSTPLYAIKSAIALSTNILSQNTPRSVGRFIGSDTSCGGAPP